MVALLRHQPAAGRPFSEGPVPRPLPLRLVSAEPVVDRRHGSAPLAEDEPVPPRLELVPEFDGSVRLPLGTIAAVALVVFGLLGAVRIVQGSLSSASPSLDGVPVAIAEGDQTVVALPGDSLWSIATRIAPDRDPRPVVVALIDANGGESVQIGQQIVIPSHLLD